MSVGNPGGRATVVVLALVLGLLVLVWIGGLLTPAEKLAAGGIAAGGALALARSSRARRARVRAELDEIAALSSAPRPPTVDTLRDIQSDVSATPLADLVDQENERLEP